MNNPSGMTGQNVFTSATRMLQQGKTLISPLWESVAIHGFRMKFLAGFPAAIDNSKALRPKTEEEDAKFQPEHERFLQMGVARFVRNANEPPARGQEDEHLQPTYTLTKWSETTKGVWKKKVRQIFNEKVTNKQLEHLRFKMTGVGVARELIRPDDWLFSIDLRDAYLNIPLAPEHYKYQRYMHRGKIYEVMTLIFGMAQAPFIFTRLIAHRWCSVGSSWQAAGWPRSYRRAYRAIAFQLSY